MDASGKTLGAVSTRSEVARRLRLHRQHRGCEKVGTAIAELAKQKGIQEVVFQRNGFLYHGRVKALADAARAAGLQF